MLESLTNRLTKEYRVAQVTELRNLIQDSYYIFHTHSLFTLQNALHSAEYRNSLSLEIEPNTAMQ